MREAKLQEDVIADLQKKGVPNYGTPNGSAQMMKNFALGNALRKRGAHDGTWDILIFRKGGDGTAGLAIELKIKPNKLSEDQVNWGERMEKEGWRCVLSVRHAPIVCACHAPAARCASLARIAPRLAQVRHPASLRCAVVYDFDEYVAVLEAHMQGTFDGKSAETGHYLG